MSESDNFVLPDGVVRKGKRLTGRSKGVVKLKIPRSNGRVVTRRVQVKQVKHVKHVPDVSTTS